MQRFSSVSDCHEIHIRRKDSTTARRFLAEIVVADSVSSSSPASKLHRKKTDTYKRHLETVPKRTEPKGFRKLYDVIAFVETSRSSASEHKAVVNCRSAH